MTELPSKVALWQNAGTDKVPAIVLPWPDPRLNPNARTHHMELARVKKAAFDDALLVTCAAVPPAARARFDNGGPISVAITFRPPDRRKRDLDNMLASSKASLDGMARALGVDDYRFELTLRRADPVKLGRVEVCFG